MAAVVSQAVAVLAPMPHPEEVVEQPRLPADALVEPMAPPPSPPLEEVDEPEQDEQPTIASDALVEPMAPPPPLEEEDDEPEQDEQPTVASDAVAAPMLLLLPPPPKQPVEEEEEQTVPAAAPPHPLESGPGPADDGHDETSPDKSPFKVPGPADEGDKETQDKNLLQVPGPANEGDNETWQDQNPLQVLDPADERYHKGVWGGQRREDDDERYHKGIWGDQRREDDDERYHKGIWGDQRREDDDCEGFCGCYNCQRRMWLFREHRERERYHRYDDPKFYGRRFRGDCYPFWQHNPLHHGNAHLGRNRYPDYRHGGYPFGPYDCGHMDMYNPRPMEPLNDYEDTRCCSRNKLIREKNDFPVAASLSNPEKWICFLNCILQCVVHTVPLVSKLLKVRHLGPCPIIRLSGDVLYPRKFVKRLKLMFPDFVRGQQQDAHEFLRCLLDKLDGVSVAPRSESEEPTSIVKEIFGGQLKSQLHCPKCNHCSDRLESFLDLNLEVNQMDTLMDSLSSYTKVEVVEDFICDGCKSRVNMEKHLKVEQAPEVLVIQLKRFQNLGSAISKIHDMVKFQLELDLNPFMSSPDDKPQHYDLYGVVEHLGGATNGHYICYIRSSETDWFRFDDEKVAEITEDGLLKKNAYLLFYVKKGSSSWFSTLLEKKEMLLSDYFKELSDKELDEDGIPKAGSFSTTDTDSDEHGSEGSEEKNEAGPSSQGNANGSTLCSVPDKNEVGCSIGGGPSGSGETQKPTSLPLSSVENGNASGLLLLLEYKEKPSPQGSHGIRETSHNGLSSEVHVGDSHGGSSQENVGSCHLLQSSSHEHEEEDSCPENLTLPVEDGVMGFCDSSGGSLHASGSSGTSRLTTVGSNSDRTIKDGGVETRAMKRMRTQSAGETTVKKRKTNGGVKNYLQKVMSASAARKRARRKRR